jgi:triosephosphate isomerase
MQKQLKLGKKHTPLVIGNWKMNPMSLDSAEKLFVDIKKAVDKKNTIAQVVIAPPFVFLSTIQRLALKTRFQLGAQDSFYEQAGAFTGETSTPMLKSMGVSYVIVGHSMRRELGESDEIVCKKTEAVLKKGLTAVVCVGEKKRDMQGDYFGIIEQQINSVLKNISKAHLHRLVIAYEPIWAIGTGVTATSENIQEMKLFIQKIISDECGRQAVSKVRIIYGGSVNKGNAQSLLETGEADGFLVGGASLKASEFAEIVKISDEYGKL